MKHLRILLVILTLLGTIAASAQDIAGDLLGRINNLRSSLGLPGYTLNGALNAAAQNQAQWMVDTGQISHSRPDGSTPRTRAAAAGYPSNWVSENIYMGTIATVNDSWNFWLNSAIHYAGMTNPNYSEIGIGSAYSTAWGRSFVLVFGNPTGLQQAAARPRNSSQPAAPPSFVVGLDKHGNIMHEIQPGDTLGDIALLYGYTWDDIPYMLELNGMTQSDIRELEIGSVFLVPPQDGTYTPTPDNRPTATPTPEAQTSPVEAVIAAAPTITPLPAATATPSPTPPHVATSQSLPEQLLFTPTGSASPAATAAAAVATDITPQNIVIRDNTISPWLIAGIVLQIGVLIVATIEFIRRLRR